jgi:hypothetical protein
MKTHVLPRPRSLKKSRQHFLLRVSLLVASRQPDANAPERIKDLARQCTELVRQDHLHPMTWQEVISNEYANGEHRRFHD